MALDPAGPARQALDAAAITTASALVTALFGVELQTLLCALVGAWIGAPLARRLEPPGDALAVAPTWPDKTLRALRAVLSYFAAAIASAVFATLLAGDPTTPGTVGLRNAAAVGIGIGFYVLVAKFFEDPIGTLASLFGRFRNPPPPPPPPGGSST